MNKSIKNTFLLNKNENYGNNFYINRNIISSIYSENEEKKIKRKIMLMLKSSTHKNIADFFLQPMWKILNNVKLLTAVLKSTNKAPKWLQLVILKILNLFYCFSFKIFAGYHQNEKALRIARILRVFFYTNLATRNNREGRIYVQACLNAIDTQRVCKIYKDLQNVVVGPLAFLVGKAFLLQGEYSKAEKFFLNAIKNDEKNVEILRFLGIIKVILGDLPSAEEMFANRINLNHSLMLPHQNLASRYDLYRPLRPSKKELENSGAL